MDNATLQENLLQEGWNISPAGLEQINQNKDVTDVKGAIKKLLDVDLRTVSKGTLPDDINKTKYESLPGGIVLQLQKVKNVSSPKYQEVSNNVQPSILKFVLTDGVQNVQGVGMELIPSLHLNSLPGSKLLFTGEITIAHCFLLLTQENTCFIGGRVETMIEKWELNRTLAKYRRDTQEEGGPPPWIPFGQKIAKQVVADTNFKSLEQGKCKEVVENTEFEAQRKGAILEASKIGAPKVFGGGNNKLLDHGVQVIVDAGFSIQQAEYTLKLTKNNPDRALRILQAKTSKPGKEDGVKGNKEERGERSERGGKAGRGRGRHRDDDSTCLKPSAKVSLFDFLEDKLPTPQEKEFNVASHDLRNNGERKGMKSGRGGGSYGERGGGGRRGGAERKPFQEIVSRSTPRSTVYEPQRNLTPKLKHDASSRAAPRWSDQRDPKPGGVSKSFGKSEKSYEEDSARKGNFVAPHEKPPRFQKMANQHVSEAPSDAPANCMRLSRHPPQLAQLTPLHQTHDHILPPNVNKNMNMFYQGGGSVNVPNEGHRAPFQRRSPNPPAPPSASNSYPGLPTVPDYPFKTNGTIMQGFNDFQAVFGNAPRTSNNTFNSTPLLPFTTTHPYLSAQQQQQMMQQPPPASTQPTAPPRRWSWKKGHKCYARYWEDQNYYEALVTGVSENTCVVHFIEYGNYEEVLHDDCVPIPDSINPEGT